MMVLDEADRLLDGGFRKDLTTILNNLPDPSLAPRQTLLFSATISEEIRKVSLIVVLWLTADCNARLETGSSIHLYPH